MRFVTRTQWGARKAKAPADFLPSTRGVKVHYMGSRVDPRLKDDHDRCAALVRQVQNGHMDGNGWNDVGYNLLVCSHGYVHEGRGKHRLPAANGSGLNQGHYAVLGMVGNAGLVEPSDAMLDGIRDAVEYLRAEGNAGSEIKGHRDGYSTDCPGPKLYAWVKDGAPRPKTSASGEDDVAAKDVWEYPIETGEGKPWKAATVLGHLEKEQDATNAKLDALALDGRTLRDEVAALSTAVAEIKALLVAPKDG